MAMQMNDEGHGSGGGNRKRGYKVFARMSSRNPYLGTFHHAPTAGNVGAKYFNNQIIPEEEWEKRKSIRQNPHTGTFHNHLQFNKLRRRYERKLLNKSKPANTLEARNHTEKSASYNSKSAEIWETWSPKFKRKIPPTVVTAASSFFDTDYSVRGQFSIAERGKGGTDGGAIVNKNDELGFLSSATRSAGKSFESLRESRQRNTSDPRKEFKRKIPSVSKLRGFSDSNDDWILYAAEIASKRAGKRREILEKGMGTDAKTLEGPIDTGKTKGKNYLANFKESLRLRTKIAMESNQSMAGARPVQERSKSDPDHMVYNHIGEARLIESTNSRHRASPGKTHRSARNSGGEVESFMGQSFNLIGKKWEEPAAPDGSRREKVPPMPLTGHGIQLKKKNWTVHLPIDKNDTFYEKPRVENTQSKSKDERATALKNSDKSIHVSPVLRFQVEVSPDSIPPLALSTGVSALKKSEALPSSNPTVLSVNTEQPKARLYALESEDNSPKAKSFDELKPWFIHHTAVSDIYETEKFASGYGTYSRVYKCKHKKLGGEFAIKSINKKYLITEVERQSVRTEIEIHLRFHHPNIVQLYEVYEDENSLHLVMEQATEGTLAECYYGRLPERSACQIVHELLLAVSHLHDNGILHSDLKPDNILLNKAPIVNQEGKYGFGNSTATHSNYTPGSGIVNENIGRVQICDFGLARKVPNVKYFRLTGDVHKVPFTGVCGTPGYIAPEILLKEAYGKSADLWSVGIIMFELLAGYSPFRPYEKCVSSTVSFSGSCFESTTSEAKQLILDLLVVNPSDRATAKQALSSPWFELFGIAATPTD